MAYVLTDGDGQTVGVFSGGSMLFDATGRTDLVGPDHTRDLTVAQYHSVRRLADEQREANPTLTQDEQQFVDELLANLSEYPVYYAHMATINSEGPPEVDLSVPEPVDVRELLRRIGAGEWVVDLRNRTAFAAAHLRGSVGFELSSSFVTYLGWLYQWGAPLTLIGDDEGQIAEAKREIDRIGIDDVFAHAVKLGLTD